MMKKNTNNILLIVFCLVLNLAFAFNSFDVSNAQTVPNTNPTKQTVSPTPPINIAATPRISPTPEVEETLKIDTELVNLNVRVVDRNNRSITNLTKNDFKVYEDNVSQPIEFFSKSEVPTNYTLLIDNSGSLRFQLEKVIEAGKIIINTNRPDDETSIIRFVSSDKIEIEQDFTPNKNDLYDSLDNLYIEGGQTAIIDAVYLAAEKVTDYEKTNNPNDRKRRALVLVTDGEDRDSFYKEAQLYELLRETDVQIYVIGFVNELSKEGGFISKSPQGKAKAFLERLATETGGKVYFPNNLNELNTIAQDIASELRTQYSIGYLPSDEASAKDYRNIKVTVADGPKSEKRIAITRSGINRAKDTNAKPSLQNTNQVKKP
ncbi:MAG: VWA domain-containing protein [Acidobacteriota bacterium]